MQDVFCIADLSDGARVLDQELTNAGLCKKVGAKTTNCFISVVVYVL